MTDKAITRAWLRLMLAETEGNVPAEPFDRDRSLTIDRVRVEYEAAA